jgi:hypothetical protein
VLTRHLHVQGKESWDMSNDEKIAFGVAKKNAGNELYKRGDLERAAKKYSAALALFKYEKQFAGEELKRVQELTV